jgi:Bacterial membrane protein YfhO
MLLAVVITYWPLPPAGVPPGSEWALSGFDFGSLHARRLRYAREALFGEQGRLPGWYTRELGGTPFWSNIQNFPLIPTRLVLLSMDPEQAFAVGVQMAAVLAALFTYLFCRRVGLGVVGSAVGGWTFAAAGFFAARVRAGHLPLLEAYPALPLLLWLAEVNLRSAPGDRRRWAKLLAMASASAAVALAGHPQVPFYSFAATGLYLAWRGRSRQGAVLAVAMLLGIGLASVSLYPMALLVQRSTRVLALDASPNDVAFPVGRLWAFVAPWADGWPAAVHRGFAKSFGAYPNITYFWDTVGYVGLLPIAACALLAVCAVVTGRRPSGVWLFLTVVGALALFLALPAWHDAMRRIPGTMLRSPARQIYLTTFALAMAAAAATDWGVAWARSRRSSWAMAAVAAALAFHAVDLGYFHDRAFVVSTPVPSDPNGREARALAEMVGAQRIAIDYQVYKPYTRGIDDVGVFDSVILARPYRALMEATGAAPGKNVQIIDSAELVPRALRFFGVNTVVAASPRGDLPRLNAERLRLYNVPDAIPRASLVPQDQVLYLSGDEIHRRLGQQDFDLATHLLLPDGSPRSPQGSGPGVSASVHYGRPSADVIVLDTQSPSPAYLRVLETWDPGWRAALDGASIPLIPAYDVFMAVPVPAGAHQVVVTFSTPGARAGLAVSGLSLALLLVLCWWQRRAAPLAPQRSVD